MIAIERYFGSMPGFWSALSIDRGSPEICMAGITVMWLIFHRIFMVFNRTVVSCYGQYPSLPHSYLRVSVCRWNIIFCVGLKFMKIGAASKQFLLLNGCALIPWILESITSCLIKIHLILSYRIDLLQFLCAFFVQQKETAFLLNEWKNIN